MAVEGQTIDDGRCQARVRKGMAPFAEGGICRERDGGTLLSLSDDLEQQLGAVRLEVKVAQLGAAQQVDAAVAGDGARQVRRRRLRQWVLPPPEVMATDCNIFGRFCRPRSG